MKTGNFNNVDIQESIEKEILELKRTPSLILTYLLTAEIAKARNSGELLTGIVVRKQKIVSVIGVQKKGLDFYLEIGGVPSDEELTLVIEGRNINSRVPSNEVQKAIILNAIESKVKQMAILEDKRIMSSAIYKQIVKDCK